MGCQGSRQSSGTSEQFILHMQKQLKFGNISSQKIDYTVRKHSLGYSINQNQWKEITQSLQIPHKNSSNCPQLEEFYSYFKADQNTISSTNILILALLLSDGPNKERLLFEAGDMEYELVLNKEKYLEFVDIMIENSVNLLPRLVCEPEEKKKVDRYMAKLYAQKEHAKPQIAEILLGTDVDDTNKKAQFVSNCKHSSHASDLLTPHGIRMHLRALHKEFKANLANTVTAEALGGGRKSKKRREQRKEEMIEERKQEMQEKQQEAEKESSSSSDEKVETGDNQADTQ